MMHVSSVAPLTLIALAASLPAMDSSPKPHGDPNHECPGQWVELSRSVTARAEPTTPESMKDSSIEMSNSATAAIAELKIKTRVNLTGDYTDTARIARATLDETYVWQWQPQVCPIVNKDVTVQIDGSIDLKASIEMSGNDDNDKARIEQDYTAQGKGIVGGQDVAVLALEEHIRLSSRDDTYSSTAASSALFRANGSGSIANPNGTLKPKGDYNGSVAGSYEYSAASQSAVSGKSSISNSWQISILITNTSNTNNVPEYRTILVQRLSSQVVTNSSTFDATKTSSDCDSSLKISPRINP